MNRFRDESIQDQGMNRFRIRRSIHLLILNRFISESIQDQEMNRCRDESIQDQEVNRFLPVTGRLTFDDLPSDGVVELLLGRVGLEHAVKVVRFALQRHSVQRTQCTHLLYVLRPCT